MKRTYVYLIIFALCATAMLLDWGIRDTFDLALTLTAAVLLSAVFFILVLVAVAIYRAVRYWKGFEIHPDYLLNHATAWRSERIFWSEIDEFAIKMIRGRFGEIPHFFLHRAPTNKMTDLSASGSLDREAVREIQRLVREKSLVYRQRDIDWEARWVEADPMAKFEREQQRREKVSVPENREIDSSFQKKRDEMLASGMSDKEILAEYLRHADEYRRRKNQHAELR